jgi:hypothetical protein
MFVAHFEDLSVGGSMLVGFLQKLNEINLPYF